MTSPEPPPRYEPEPASAARDTAVDPLVRNSDNLPVAYTGPPPETYSGPSAQYGAPPTPYPTPAYPPPYPYYSPYPYIPKRPTNGLAVGALVASIIGLFTLAVCLPVGIVGIILGHVARSQIRRTQEDGDGLALAGIIVGWAGLGIVLLLAILFTAPFILLIALAGSN